MNRMPCRWILERLPLIAGGDLRGIELRSVELHLRTCASCRARLTEHERALDALHAVAFDAGTATPEASSIWPSLAQHIRESRREPVLRLPARWGRIAGRLAVAASLLIMLTGAGICVWKYSPYRIVVKPPSIRLTRLPRPVVHPPLGRSSKNRTTVEQARTADERTELGGELARGFEGPSPDRRRVDMPTN